MEEEKIKRLNVFLGSQGLSCDDLPDNKRRQLLKIDGAIQARIANLKQAEEIIKQQSINTQNISKDTKISRKTFYNNEEYRLYVEYCAAEFYAKRNETQNDIKSWKEKISELEAQNKKLMLRDVETEKLRNELETSRKELANMQRVCKDLQDKYEVLLHESDPSSQKRSCTILVPPNGFHSKF